MMVNWVNLMATHPCTKSKASVYRDTLFSLTLPVTLPLKHTDT